MSTSWSSGRDRPGCPSRASCASGTSSPRPERGEIGQSWRRYYDGLVLHTGRHLSSLPGRPFRRSDPMFVTRDRFVRYLAEYAAAMDLPIVAGAEVTAVRREDGGWALDLAAAGAARPSRGDAGSSSSRPGSPRRRSSRSCPAQTASAGGSAIRSTTTVPGRSPLPRARRRRRGLGWRDRGRAGARLAPVSIAIRSGSWSVPREIAGIPSQYIGMLIRRLPRFLARPIVAAATRRRARRLPPSLPRSARAHSTRSH